jgi:4'-phosphopantetheinyl transferase
VLGIREFLGLGALGNLPSLRFKVTKKCDDKTVDSPFLSRNSQAEKKNLTTSEVEIWQISMARMGDSIQAFRSLLSHDEIQRADRFAFEIDKSRFFIARAAMRQILGWYVGVAPQELTFSYSQNGKPELRAEFGKAGLKFNLSHSCELALLAVTRGARVGIDVEFVDHKFPGEEIAERFFSVSEMKTLRSVPANQRADAFFCCWTRKEAYVKALGEGLSVPLHSFDVSFGPNAPAALMHVRTHPDEISRWSMYEINVPRGYRAALVVEGSGHILGHRQWNVEF